jgi:hypothetical protein
MNEPELPLFPTPANRSEKKKAREPPCPKEYKVTAIRDCPVPAHLQICDTPEGIADYWNRHIKTHPYYTSDREYFVAVFLNTRRKVKGHTLVSIGLLDSVLVHPREVFRAAIVASSSAVVLAHNLCVAAHKLCYVTRRLMCSPPLMALTLTRPFLRKENCAGS